jgi:hypothetical protein
MSVRLASIAQALGNARTILERQLSDAKRLLDVKAVAKHLLLPRSQCRA